MAMPLGFVLRHETMGIVEETGKEFNKVKKGNRVIIPFPNIELIMNLKLCKYYS